MSKEPQSSSKIWMKFLPLMLSVLTMVLTCGKDILSPEFRIVSLSPAMTEILFAIGAEKNLVGVTTFCDYPAEAKELYKVGDFSNPSMERIIGLKPDLVVVNIPEQKRIKNQLDQLRIKTFVSSPRTIEDIYREITAIAALVKKEKKADSLIAYMKKNLKPIKIKERKRVYVELSSRPLVTIGASTFLNELIEMAGGYNIFQDLTRDYPVVTQEQVIKRNPEIIIVLHPDGIGERLGWAEIPAVKNQRIYSGLEQDCLMRPGPRLVQGLKELKRIILE